jgi:secreted protein with Ig-like and vWFA domain
MEFYSVQLREKIEVPDNDVAITVAENGRRQARATVQRDGKAIKLFKFLPNADAAPTAAAPATAGTTGAKATTKPKGKAKT